MPFTAGELTLAANASIDFYNRNKPVDQYNQQRPLLSWLESKKRPFAGALQYVVSQLRFANGSNFQWFYGSQTVTYNTRDLLKQSKYRWSGIHDGFTLNEDQLLQNGITLLADDDKPKQNSAAERVQLTNLLNENIASLYDGFDEKFDQALWLDGTQSAEAVPGIDFMVSLTPTTGTVGGIDRASNVWWRNNVFTGLTSTAVTGDIIDKMELAWRQCSLHAGRPTKIFAGGSFIDAYRKFLMASNGRINFDPMARKRVDGGTGEDGLYFMGIPIEWNPTFDLLDTLYAPATPWVKRCYFLNERILRLRPIDNQDRVKRMPPRVSTNYVIPFGLTWKGALECTMPNGCAVLAIA